MLFYFQYEKSAVVIDQLHAWVNTKVDIRTWSDNVEGVSRSQVSSQSESIDSIFCLRKSCISITDKKCASNTACTFQNDAEISVLDLVDAEGLDSIGTLSEDSSFSVESGHD